MSVKQKKTACSSSMQTAASFVVKRRSKVAADLAIDNLPTQHAADRAEERRRAVCSYQKSLLADPSFPATPTTALTLRVGAPRRAPPLGELLGAASDVAASGVLAVYRRRSTLSLDETQGTDPHSHS